MKILPIVAGIMGGALGIGFANAGRAGLIQAALLGAFASLLGAMLVAWVLEAAQDLREPSRLLSSLPGARIPRS
jgi:chromate transport protein ChrA